jgi:hypothetical protein
MLIFCDKFYEYSYNIKMHSPNVFLRHEKKYLLTLDQFFILKKQLLKVMTLDPYCHQGQMYHLRNIYYDTPDHQLISLSLLKPDFKEKIRLRKYGVQGDGNKLVFLEVKRKVKGLVTKRRAALSIEEIHPFMTSSIIPSREDYRSQQILHELAYMNHVYDLHQALFIEYDRLAFYDSVDREFRVTFDHNIQTRYDDFDFESRQKGLPLLAENQVLMEVKVGQSMPIWFTQLLSSLEIYVHSFSKYGKAYEAEIVKEL